MRPHIIHNRLIPVRPFAAINICGLIFVRRGIRLSEKELNHECIHTLQQREMLYIPFYVFYVAEWLVRLLITRNAMEAYRNISFEREAYDKQDNLRYGDSRTRYAWTKYVWHRQGCGNV